MFVWERLHCITLDGSSSKLNQLRFKLSLSFLVGRTPCLVASNPGFGHTDLALGPFSSGLAEKESSKSVIRGAYPEAELIATYHDGLFTGVLSKPTSPPVRISYEYSLPQTETHVGRFQHLTPLPMIMTGTKVRVYDSCDKVLPWSRGRSFYNVQPVLPSEESQYQPAMKDECICLFQKV